MSAPVLIPQARLSGPTPWVIAIMVTLCVIAAATTLALRNMANAAELDLAGGVSVQIIEARGAERSAQARRAVAALEQAARDGGSVALVRQVSARESEELLAPWLGGLAAGEAGGGELGAGLPVPVLIDVQLRGPADAAAVARLRAMLRKVAPAARVDAQALWLAPVFAAVDSLRWLALALMGLLALAMVAAVLLSARSALGANRATVEIVHNLGGTDRQIAGIFQRSVGVDAAAGAAVGFALGLVVVTALGARFGALGAGLVAGGALDFGDWLLLALVPLMAVGLAMVTARATVLVALRGIL